MNLAQKKNPLRSCFSHKWSIILANFLEHYDSALYGFLAPLLGKTFFPEASPLYQMILVYGIYVITFAGRPLGGIFFSKLTYKYDPFNVLLASLIGVAIATGMMGILPSSKHIGIFAPLSLVFVRFVQSFCAAGESAIAGYFLIEHVEQKKQISWSSFFQSSSVIGILAASSLSTYVLNSANELWRMAFLLGFVLGIWAIGMRFYFGVGPTISPIKLNKKAKFFPGVKKHGLLIISLVPIYGLSYLVYSFPLVLLNPYISLIGPTPLSTMMEHTNILLWVDALIFPIVAICFQKFDWAKVMVLSAAFFALCAAFLLTFAYKESITMIFICRFLLVSAGVCFAATLIPWTNRLLPQQDKYLVHSISYNLGSELFGRSTPFICFWLYGLMNNPSAPLIYIFSLTFIAVIFVMGLELKYKKSFEVSQGYA